MRGHIHSGQMTVRPGGAVPLGGAAPLLNQQVPGADPVVALLRGAFRAAQLALAALVCGTPFALAAEPKDRVVAYPAGTDTPVSLTLLVRHEKMGRDNPFYDNYRPQLRFSAERREITCTVRIAPPREKVEPGETADVALNCPEPFHVFERNKSFIVHEGGRKVAEGALR